MGKAERLEAKIKRLRRIEASYRNEIRRSDAEMETVDSERARRKHERRSAKYNYKIELLSEKVRALTTKRAQLVK